MLLFHSGVQQHPILSIEEKASRVLSLAHGHRWKCAYGFDFRFDSRDVALEGRVKIPAKSAWGRGKKDFMSPCR